ncbi:MAG: helix-turn-helix transcriptional regulator [Candidatus Neomarinimicrobiota bacterium]
MKTNTNKITMLVEKTDTGFSAYSQNQSIFTTGKTIPELLENAFEAASLYLEDEAVSLRRDQIKFEIDFQHFFQYYKVLNAKFLAEKIGINPALLSQYVQGHKKPSKNQTEKILLGIHNIGKELADINLIFNR